MFRHIQTMSMGNLNLVCILKVPLSFLLDLLGEKHSQNSAHSIVTPEVRVTPSHEHSCFIESMFCIHGFQIIRLLVLPHGSCSQGISLKQFQVVGTWAGKERR